jgi:anti-sigma factor ChrR (cupin superfamily)
MDEPVVLEKLIQGGWSDYRFEPFREGIEICVLYEKSDATLALLRYLPGAQVPLHRHTGLETVIVLEGSQSDERGLYPQGSCVLNPSGFQHSVRSEQGCVVLVHWVSPVEFVEQEQEA